MKNTEKNRLKKVKTLAASRGWWKSGTSKIYLNITSELQILNGFRV